jgi:Family of unknown function (DUF6169)
MALVLKNLKSLGLNLQPYNYTTFKPDYFTFTTANGCVYDCYFYNFSTAFSDYPDLAPNVYGFNLELKFQPIELKTIPPDKLVGATVVTILKTFLSLKENVVVYVCDNSDQRESARYVKFSGWFSTFNDGSILQLKRVIRVGNTNILNALLIHKDNPLANKFIEAYDILTGAYSKPDDDELQHMLNDDGW